MNDTQPTEPTCEQRRCVECGYSPRPTNACPCGAMQPVVHEASDEPTQPDDWRAQGYPDAFTAYMDRKLKAEGGI